MVAELVKWANAAQSSSFSALCPKAIPELHKSYSLTQGYKHSLALGCVKRKAGKRESSQGSEHNMTDLDSS